MKDYEDKVTYSSNSYKSKQAEESTKESPTKEPNVVQITKGVKKKPVWFKRLFGEDFNDVSSYVLYDVLIPATKKAMYDMTLGGLEMMLFKNDSKNSIRFGRDRGKTYVDYGSRSRGNNYIDYGKLSYTNNRAPKPIGRNRHDFDNVIIPTLGKAQEALSTMLDILAEYGMVKVADFYKMVGEQAEYTDTDWGWLDLSRSTIERAPYNSGYIINLEKPVWLK